MISAPDEQEAIRTAYEWWPKAAIKGELSHDHANKFSRIFSLSLILINDPDEVRKISSLCRLPFLPFLIQLQK